MGFSSLIVEEAARMSDEQYKALRPVLAVSGVAGEHAVGEAGIF